MRVFPSPAKARQCERRHQDLQSCEKLPYPGQMGATSHFFIVAKSKEHSSPGSKIPPFQEGHGLHHGG
jgi:hypothetical protein